MRRRNVGVVNYFTGLEEDGRTVNESIELAVAGEQAKQGRRSGTVQGFAMSKEMERSEKIMESKVMWYPDSKKNTQMDRFRRLVNRDFGLSLGECKKQDQWDTQLGG